MNHPVPDPYEQFLAEHGHLFQELAEAGWSRWESRGRLESVYPELPPALVSQALQDPRFVFPRPSGSPLTPTMMSCSLWMAVHAREGLGEDRDAVLLAADQYVLQDINRFLEITGTPQEDAVRFLGWLGATFRFLMEHPETTLSPEEYVAYLQNLPDLLARIPRDHPEMPPPTEHTIRSVLGHGSWDRALTASALAPTSRYSAGGLDQMPELTEERFRSAMADFLTYTIRNNHRPQALLYGSWAADLTRHRVPRPTLRTVLHAYGSWPQALEAGRALINESDPQQRDPRYQESWVGPWTAPLDLISLESPGSWTPTDWTQHGIGVVETSPAPSGTPDHPWEDLVQALEEDLAALPWHHFLTLEYSGATPPVHRPCARVFTEPGGNSLVLLDEERPLDQEFLDGAGWEPPNERSPHWSLNGLSPEETARELVHGLRFGRGCSDPYRIRWGSGALYVDAAAGAAPASLDRREHAVVRSLRPRAGAGNPIPTGGQADTEEASDD